MPAIQAQDAPRPRQKARKSSTRPTLPRSADAGQEAPRRTNAGQEDSGPRSAALDWKKPPAQAPRRRSPPRPAAPGRPTPRRRPAPIKLPAPAQISGPRPGKAAPSIHLIYSKAAPAPVARISPAQLAKTPPDRISSGPGSASPAARDPPRVRPAGDQPTSPDRISPGPLAKTGPGSTPQALPQRVHAGQTDRRTGGPDRQTTPAPRRPYRISSAERGPPSPTVAHRRPPSPRRWRSSAPAPGSAPENPTRQNAQKPRLETVQYCYMPLRGARMRFKRLLLLPI